MIRSGLAIPLCLVLGSLALACAAEPDGLNPGVRDIGGPRDADVAPDAMPSDVGPADTGVVDTGPPDTGVCVADCWLKSCGDDGCGGSCGDCLPGASCDLGTGVCACPQDTCGAAQCGSSSCGARCGDCPNGFCTAGVCEAASCAAGCRDLNFAWVCPGQTARGACTSDLTKNAVCTCDGSQYLECDNCYVDVPISCRSTGCTPGTQCNEWTAQCEPLGSPQPPAGLDNGAACAADTECRSAGAPLPGAVPQCLGDWSGGYCMSYCNAPPGGFFSTGDLEAANCPTGSLCVAVAQSLGSPIYDPSGAGACLKSCSSDSECRVDEGYFCRHQFGGMTTMRGVCAPNHCRTRGCLTFVCGC